MKSVAKAWPSIARALKAIDAYTLTCGALALIAVISALAFPGWWLALVLIAAAVTLYGPATEIVRRTKKAFLMGSGTTSRVLLLVAVLVGPGGADQAGLAISSGVAGLLILAEGALARPVGTALPLVANVPGHNVPVPSRTLATWLYVTNTATIVAIAAARFLALPSLFAHAVTVAALVLAAAMGAQAVRYLLARTRFEAELPKLMESLAPAFAFHWQAPAGTAYQAAMWLPYLERLDRPFFVLVRTADNFHEVSKLTTAPIILRLRLEDLDAVVCTSLKVVFYANTAVRNSHMIRFPALRHVQLNHGDSDKITSVSPTFRQYDKNFVAGQAAVDRFALHGVETRADQFVIVGRPQLEQVKPARAPITEIPSPVVLYSPTWSGFYEDSDYSSLVAGRPLVEALLERGCTVVFRPHPYARQRARNATACTEIISLLSADAAQTGREHIFGPVAEKEMSVVDCFNACDAMISDVSSVVSDYLISGKPFAMCAVSAHGEDFLESFPLAKAAYVIEVLSADRPDGLADLLDSMLTTDPMSAERHAARTYYLGEAEAKQCAEPFIQKARQLIDQA
jgi:hypothetical protein